MENNNQYIFVTENKDLYDIYYEKKIPFSPELSKFPSLSEYDNEGDFDHAAHEWKKQVKQKIKNKIMPLPLSLSVYTPEVANLSKQKNISSDNKSPNNFNIMKSASNSKYFDYRHNPPLPITFAEIFDKFIIENPLADGKISLSNHMVHIRNQKQIPINIYTQEEKKWGAALIPQEPSPELFDSYESYKKSLKNWASLQNRKLSLCHPSEFVSSIGIIHNENDNYKNSNLYLMDETKNNNKLQNTKTEPQNNDKHFNAQEFLNMKSKSTPPSPLLVQLFSLTYKEAKVNSMSSIKYSDNAILPKLNSLKTTLPFKVPYTRRALVIKFNDFNISELSRINRALHSYKFISDPFLDAVFTPDDNIDKISLFSDLSINQTYNAIRALKPHEYDELLNSLPFFLHQLHIVKSQRVRCRLFIIISNLLENKPKLISIFLTDVITLSNVASIIKDFAFLDSPIYTFVENSSKNDIPSPKSNLNTQNAHLSGLNSPSYPDSSEILNQPLPGLSHANSNPNIVQSHSEASSISNASPNSDINSHEISSINSTEKTSSPSQKEELLSNANPILNQPSQPNSSSNNNIILNPNQPSQENPSPPNTDSESSQPISIDSSSNLNDPPLPDSSSDSTKSANPDQNSQDPPLPSESITENSHDSPEESLPPIESENPNHPSQSANVSEGQASQEAPQPAESEGPSQLPPQDQSGTNENKNPPSQPEPSPSSNKNSNLNQPSPSSNINASQSQSSQPEQSPGANKNASQSQPSQGANISANLSQPSSGANISANLNQPSPGANISANLNQPSPGAKPSQPSQAPSPACSKPARPSQPDSPTVAAKSATPSCSAKPIKVVQSSSSFNGSLKAALAESGAAPSPSSPDCASHVVCAVKRNSIPSSSRSPSTIGQSRKPNSESVKKIIEDLNLFLFANQLLKTLTSFVEKYQPKNRDLLLQINAQTMTFSKFIDLSLTDEAANVEAAFFNPTPTICVIFHFLCDYNPVLFSKLFLKTPFYIFLGKVFVSPECRQYFGNLCGHILRHLKLRHIFFLQFFHIRYWLTSGAIMNTIAPTCNFLASLIKLETDSEHDITTDELFATFTNVTQLVAFAPSASLNLIYSIVNFFLKMKPRNSASSNMASISSLNVNSNNILNINNLVNYNYYDSSCPNFSQIRESLVALFKDPNLQASNIESLYDLINLLIIPYRNDTRPFLERFLLTIVLSNMRSTNESIVVSSWHEFRELFFDPNYPYIRDTQSIKAGLSLIASSKRNLIPPVLIEILFLALGISQKTFYFCTSNIAKDAMKKKKLRRSINIFDQPEGFIIPGTNPREIYEEVTKYYAEGRLDKYKNEVFVLKVMMPYFKRRKRTISCI